RCAHRTGLVCSRCFFFFQAEDGIRGFHVTGVQTCALPICSLTLNAQIKKDENIGGGSLLARLHNYASARDSVTDQIKNRNQKSDSQRASLTYTEPLSEVLNISVGAGIERSESSSLIESFNKSAAGVYDELDLRFSNNYTFDRLSSNYKLALNYRTEKLRLNLSNSLNND